MFNFSYWEQKYFWQNWDFTIIGSGITGLTSAYYLKQKYPKANVAVIERGFLPTGASTKNAGFACFGSMSEILDDFKHMDENAVYDLIFKRFRGLESLRALLGDKNIAYQPCGGYEIFTEKDAELFEQCKVGIAKINSGLKKTFDSDVFSDVSGAQSELGLEGISNMIFNSAEGMIDTGLMMHSLLEKVKSAGVYIFNGLDVKSIDYTADSPTINFERGSFKSKHVVVATNGFAKTLLPELDVKPGRAQVLITSPIKDLKLNGTFHHDCGYNYFRNIDNRVLLGGGRHIAKSTEETTTIGNTDEIQDYLEGLLRTHILPKQDFTIESRWSGIMGLGASKKVIVERIGPETVCAVRFGGMGVALGTQIGKEVAAMF